MTELVMTVPDERLRDDIGPIDGVEVLVWPMDAAAPRDRIDLVVPPYMTKGDPLGHLEGIETRLVQSQSIGYDGIVDKLPAGVTFANASSVHEASTAELAVALTLAAQRHIPDFVRSQDVHDWHPIVADSLADRRVVLIGFGGVGKAIAARLDGFETHIIAVASRPRTEDGIQVRGADELAEVLPDAEIVILSLPGGDGTRHFLGDRELALLPDGALVVNVGRGPLIDTDALVEHIRTRGLRAALDVTDPEPLPSDHPLWSLPGVLIAPHVGGASSAMRPRIARLVRIQAERMRDGEEPLNVVLHT